MNAQVIENAAEQRFELALPGGAMAAAYYRIDNAGRLVLTHTETPDEFAGQGYASRLAQGTFELIRSSGRKAVLICPFMTAYFGKHPEWADIIAG